MSEVTVGLISKYNYYFYQTITRFCNTTARRTIKGYEAMNMVRKGQIQGVAKGDIRTQTEFVSQLFGVAA